MNALRKYRAIFAVGLQNTVVYRWNFLLRTLFGLVPLFGAVYLWRAIFDSRGQSIAGYDFGSMIYYFLLIILVENLITPTEDEWQIAADIRDGQINALLAKPISYLSYRISLYLGYRVVYTAVTLPMVAVLFFCFRQYITFPHVGMTWFWTALSLGMAAFLQFFIAYSLAMLAFWILEISTVVFIVFSFEYFLSGQLFPLDLAPRWLGSVLQWLPFTYELFFPITVFQEKVSGAALAKGLCIQAGWLFLSWLVARTMWARGLRRYQAVGG